MTRWARGRATHPGMLCPAPSLACSSVRRVSSGTRASTAPALTTSSTLSSANRQAPHQRGRGSVPRRARVRADRRRTVLGEGRQLVGAAAQDDTQVVERSVREANTVRDVHQGGHPPQRLRRGGRDTAPGVRADGRGGERPARGQPAESSESWEVSCFALLARPAGARAVPTQPPRRAWAARHAPRRWGTQMERQARQGWSPQPTCASGSLSAPRRGLPRPWQLCTSSQARERQQLCRRGQASSHPERFAERQCSAAPQVAHADARSEQPPALRMPHPRPHAPPWRRAW